tara:strand:- start:161 stop:493 length:333 start_codon:yes stop_codon:yes gene_type:complete
MNKSFFIFIFLLTFIFPDELKSQDKEKWKVSLIPTMGQIKNKKYLKAGILAITQSYSVYKCLEYDSNDKISKRNTYAWWFLGLYFYGIIDSYVDYNLKNFPNELDNKKEE